MNESLCRACRIPLPENSGRPSRYCSAACRQRAYRARTRSAPKPQQSPDTCPGLEVPHLTAQELLAWRGMLEVQTRLVRRLDADLQRQADLTTTEFDVLYRLWTAPGRRLRMNQLSGVVTPSAVTRIITRLAGRGLVARATVPGRQAVDARLTKEGGRKLERAMDILFRDIRREFIDRIPAPDITRLAALWTRLGPLAAGTTTEQGQNPDML